MKQLLIFAVLTLALTGCYNGASSSGKSKSFAQQIAELEAQPVPQDAAALPAAEPVGQNEADRAMEVAAQAQKERRAEAPLVESNYIFNVMPNKGTYTFDEYDQVVTDDPKTAEYKDNKRLWTKPKRIKPDAYGQEPSAESTSEAAAPAEDSAPASASSSDEYSYEDEY